jgi:arylsulfatase A-like enzyme
LVRSSGRITPTCRIKCPPIANPHPSNSFEAYLDAIAFTDLMIGDLISLLRRRNLFENTVVVLVGDHGEAFNEHPESGLGHGDWLFEVTAHVPLVLINPRLFHGEGDDRIVQQKDVAATVTWLAGDRRTYLNVGSPIFFRKTSEAAYLTSHFDVSSLRGALVRGRLKYVFRAAAEGLPGDDRLFDLVADPGETANLWRARAEEGREMKAQYFGWLTYWNERWMAVELRAKPVSRAWLDATLFTSEASPNPSGHP